MRHAVLASKPSLQPGKLAGGVAIRRQSVSLKSIGPPLPTIAYASPFAGPPVA
jgi:hypothetical protein